MKTIKIILVLLTIGCFFVMSIHASDANLGQEDDFGDNAGQEDEVQSSEENTQEPTRAETATPAETETAASDQSEATEQESPQASTEKSTTGSFFGSDRVQVWSLPMPIIWGAIALFGIGGTVAAILLLRKYIKEG